MLKKIDDIEGYYKTFSNEEYEKILIFEKYQYPLGDVVYYIKGDYYELC